MSLNCAVHLRVMSEKKPTMNQMDKDNIVAHDIHVEEIPNILNFYTRDIQ